MTKNYQKEINSMYKKMENVMSQMYELKSGFEKESDGKTLKANEKYQNLDKRYDFGFFHFRHNLDKIKYLICSGFGGCNLSSLNEEELALADNMACELIDFYDELITKYRPEIERLRDDKLKVVDAKIK